MGAVPARTVQQLRVAVTQNLRRAAPDRSRDTNASNPQRRNDSVLVLRTDSSCSNSSRSKLSRSNSSH